MPVPWWTIGLVVAALVVAWVPDAADLLIYDRARILGGELWRIVTGHWVHFSKAHLLANLALLVPAAWIVESRYGHDAGLVLAIASIVVGIALLLGEPDVVEFGGASGMSLAFLAYACLRGLEEEGRWRAVCAVALATLMAKFVAEAAGWSVRDWQIHEGFVTVTSSHIVGAATGAALYASRRVARKSPTGARLPFGR